MGNFDKYTAAALEALVELAQHGEHAERREAAETILGFTFEPPSKGDDDES